MVEQIIREVYYDLGDGFASIAEKLRLGRQRDAPITRKQVKCFLDEQDIRQRKRGKVFNSYVVDWPRVEFRSRESEPRTLPSAREGAWRGTAEADESQTSSFGGHRRWSYLSAPAGGVQ